MHVEKSVHFDLTLRLQSTPVQFISALTLYNLNAKMNSICDILRKNYLNCYSFYFDNWSLLENVLEQLKYIISPTFLFICIFYFYLFSNIKTFFAYKSIEDINFRVH